MHIQNSVSKSQYLQHDSYVKGVIFVSGVSLWCAYGKTAANYDNGTMPQGEVKLLQIAIHQKIPPLKTNMT